MSGSDRAFFVRPLDVLLFRDGRPFSAGDDHRASGLFPPPPSTFYGALRAAALARHGARFRRGHPFGLDEDSDVIREAGGTGRTAGMAITHFSLAYERDDGAVVPLYPMPNDVLRIKQRVPDAGHAPTWLRVVPEGFGGSEQRVRPRVNQPVTTLRALWRCRDERVWYEDRPGLVTQDAFAEYLADGTPPPPFRHPSPWRDTDGTRSAFSTEPRTSLEIKNASRTADDGKLYTVEYTRPNGGVGFALHLRNAGSLGDEAAWLRLGGEARAARLEPLGEPHPLASFPRVDEIKAGIEENGGRFTVVLATPAPFDGGWLPDGIGADGTGTLGPCRVRLVGAALGRFQNLGGWDIVNRRPYPTRRAVPPGSVYFFEIASGDLDGAVEALFDPESGCFGRSLFADDDYRRKLGLGIAYLGTWEPQPENGHA